MRLNLLFYTPLQLLFKSKEASSGLFLHSGAYKKGIILVFICPKIISCVKSELVCMQNHKKGRMKGACLFLLYARAFFFSQQGRINALFLRFICPPAYFRAVSALKYPCERRVARTFSLFAVVSAGNPSITYCGIRLSGLNCGGTSL